MSSRLKHHSDSLKYAFNGIKLNFRQQPSFQFHLLAILVVSIFGVYFSLTGLEWLILLFTFNMVIVAEMVNTSIESIVDLITKEKREDARVAKDVAAGMVLVSAIFAIIIGIYIFVPKLTNLFI